MRAEVSRCSLEDAERLGAVREPLVEIAEQTALGLEEQAQGAFVPGGLIDEKTLVGSCGAETGGILPQRFITLSHAARHQLTVLY